MVLRALSCHAESSDREIAALVGMSPSTFTTIKHRLRSMGAYTRVRVPAAWKLGWDVISFRTVRAMCGPPLDSGCVDGSRGSRWDILNVRDIDSFFSLSFYRTAVDWQIGRSASCRHPHCIGSVETVSVDLPNEPLEVLNFLDLDGVVSCGHDRRPYRSGISEEIGPIPRSILDRFVEEPDGTNSDIAALMDLNRQTVGKHHQMLLDEDLLLERNVPNFRYLGKTVMTVTFLKLEEHGASELQGLERKAHDVSIMNMSSYTDQVIVCVHDDLGSALWAMDSLIDEYGEKGLIKVKPHNSLLDISADMPLVCRENIRSLMADRVIGP